MDKKSTQRFATAKYSGLHFFNIMFHTTSQPDRLEYEDILLLIIKRLLFRRLFTSKISPRSITIGNMVAKSKPIFKLPPTASAILPTIAGLTVAPKSPANARKANIAVPPFGHF